MALRSPFIAGQNNKVFYSRYLPKYFTNTPNVWVFYLIKKNKKPNKTTDSIGNEPNNFSRTQRCFCNVLFYLGNICILRSTLKVKDCLKENAKSGMGRKRMFMALLFLCLLTYIIISNCYVNINTRFNYAKKLLEWFRHLKLLWKYTDFKLDFICYKTVRYSDACMEL